MPNYDSRGSKKARFIKKKETLQQISDFIVQKTTSK